MLCSNDNYIIMVLQTSGSSIWHRHSWILSRRRGTANHGISFDEPDWIWLDDAMLCTGHAVTLNIGKLDG